MSSNTSTPWPRNQWTPGEGGQALLVFFVFGRFPRELDIPAARYGSPGLPHGIELKRHAREDLAGWVGHPLAGALGDVLKAEQPDAVARAAAQPEILTVRGTRADLPDLAYLRDTIGVLTALLDVGGTHIVDPQILGLFDASAWRERFPPRQVAAPRQHVLILCNEEDDRHAWIHSRGMRKFARPDISIGGVPTQDIEHAGALCARLVDMQAMGARLHDGQTLELAGLPGPLTMRVGGSMDDPRFNNTHVALRWPGIGNGDSGIGTS